MKNNSPDNFQTDPEALNCLVRYLPKEGPENNKALIWEPAMGAGNLVKTLGEFGFHVEGTDIISGFDFLSSSLPYFDCIVTNPPYSLKEEFLARCYQLGKPFALLMPLTTFDSVERRTLFAQHGLEVIFPQRRINFETPNHAKNVAAGRRTNSWFYTAWFTHGLNIGKQLVFSDPKTFSV